MTKLIKSLCNSAFIQYYMRPMLGLVRCLFTGMFGPLAIATSLAQLALQWCVCTHVLSLELMAAVPTYLVLLLIQSIAVLFVFSIGLGAAFDPAQEKVVKSELDYFIVGSLTAFVVNLLLAGPTVCFVAHLSGIGFPVVLKAIAYCTIGGALLSTAGIVDGVTREKH